ncbi:MAG: ROK family protein [Candidatus Latescibacteria bacterium]|nr:ROK family protein [Candidatus Latescibacterota bacterium]
MKNHVIGIEIGGTKLQAGLGFDGDHLKALARETIDPSRGPEAILSSLKRLIPDLLHQAGLRLSGIAGIGVGFGGPVDAARGRVLISHQVEGWSGFDLQTWFERTFSLPAAIENDASAAALAEAHLGAGKGCRRVFYVTVGSGVGGGWVVDGVVDSGQGIGSAEIGHTFVSLGTSPPQKVEDLCSGWAIGRRAQEVVRKHPDSLTLKLASGESDRITAVTVSDAARQGDPLALRVLDETGHAMGLAVANLITLLHPEVVVIGGGVSLMEDLFFEPLRRHVGRYVFHLYADTCRIVPATLGEQVVVVGAAWLARQKFSERL